MSADYLIIGAGITGSLLSRALARRGKTVLLLRSPEQPGSSDVAAWMLSPITGLRFSASWRIETLLPFAHNLYRELEEESGLKLFHEQRILRFLKSAEERQRWDKRASDPAIRTYASLLPPAETGSDPISIWNTFGCVEIRGGGWVDLKPWLTYHEKNPGPSIRCLTEHLRAEDLLVSPNKVEWKGKSFSKALFCTGYSHWPWFDWLPWKASKGETLCVRIPDLNLDDIVKKGVFLIPLGDDLYRVGATYSWNPLDHHPTPAGRDHLLQALQKLTSLPVEILSHRAGVRPSFQGTIPAIGLHPRHPSLGIVNGLGSKGGLSAPWLSDHFACHLESGTPIDAEVDIARNT